MEPQTQYHTLESIELVDSSSRHDFPLHFHRVFCAGVVTQGQLIFQLEDVEFILSSNDLYFVPAGVAHTIRSYRGTSYQHLVVCIQEHELAQIPDAGVLNHENLGISFRNLINESMQSAKEENLLQFINEIGSSHLKAVDKKQETAILNEVLDYVQKHLDEPFSLNELCTSVSLSKFHLIRLIKAQCGLTPHQLVLQEKIRAVKSGILHADAAGDLAYRYQFTDQSHLCHVFKKYVGMTPIQYQKNRLT
jgi:AraC-like DNA-binding protein